MSEIKDGGPAFPSLEIYEGYDRDQDRYTVKSDTAPGMTLRDYFAIRAPEPTKEAIESVAERERMANPHGDTYKPVRRSWREIRAALRYEFADDMLKAREAK